VTDFFRPILEKIARDPYWTMVGFFAQFLFFSRFIVQWIASERKKKSVVPVSFWFLSLAGGIALLIYSIHECNAVFIVGQATGSLIYLRNLVLIYSHKAAQKAT